LRNIAFFGSRFLKVKNEYFNIKEINIYSKKAIFLDSDGVLNKAILKDGKPVAPRTLAELVIPDEVKPSLDKLKAAGYLLICLTNKPDVERGLTTKGDVDAIYAKIRSELPLDDVFICYSENSDCYKPKPGLLLAASKKYDINLAQSYMIGDRWRDIEAGQNAKCKTVWIDRGYAEKKPDPPADYTVHSLTEGVEWILGKNQ
jgi:D-glycero-D-manno-heptose 1,7-bisphosphate phosphatase